MSRDSLDVEQILAFSLLFRYPAEWPGERHLGVLAAVDQEASDFLAHKDLTALQAAYVRLFINALPEVPCPPYGSFYLEETLKGASTVKLEELYRDYGLLAHELADHIAVELEFLALLTALGSNPVVQEDVQFLLDHLRQWTPAFFARVEENDATGFYRDVARGARTLIEKLG